MTIRTRFAPSPTGALHLGALRTALFSWLTAKHLGGQFFLRIEDTDQERFVPGTVAQIFESLRWVGVTFDGGPDHKELQILGEDFPGAIGDGGAGGIPGPFVQSQRLSIYREHAEMLIARGFAYRSNETSEELDRMRQAAQAEKRTFLFKQHSRLRTDVRADEKHVVRLAVPAGGQTILDDIILGQVVFENANQDDPVLLKSDGFATYHLAAMVDDHLMGVTHVIRSQEWLPSAPKHLHLFQCLGWAAPRFAHVPAVNGEDGRKLSKRHGATGVFEFRDQGYLPEAVLNFLALLGWAPGEGDEQNVFTQDELIAKFSLEHVGASPAIFSYPKLDWLNGMHMRRLAPDDLADRLTPFLAQAGIPVDSPARRAKLLEVMPLIQERLKKLSDAAGLVDFIFGDIPVPARDMLVGARMDAAQSRNALLEVRAALAAHPFNDDAGIELALRDLCASLGLKPAQLFSMIRNAISGKTVTPPLFGTLRVLGRDAAVTRLDRAIAALEAQ